MKRSLLIGLALATALAAAPAAKADSTYYFSLSGPAVTDTGNPNCCAPSISGNGYLTGVWDPSNPGNFDITGSSGVTFTFNWGSSSPASPSLVGTYNASIYLAGEPTSPPYPYSIMYYPPGSNSSNFIFPYDDLLTPGSMPVVDNSGGILFELSGAGTNGYEAGIAIYSGTAENPANPCTSSADCVYWWDEYWASPDISGDPYYGVPNSVYNPNGAYGDPLDKFFLSPEPSSLLMFGTGLFGLAAFLYRRRLTEQHRAA
ncbi:MAG TPA: PEP-CTERM sorting domain-containing protein [Terracidiphilus sp.]|nr:PEP-CTERM sorting domain-containing protein [Terracidiphilus sp.]